MAQTYLLGTQPSYYRPGSAYYIDLLVTEDCNLRCSYCYLTGKNAAHPMSSQVARDAVDFFLGMPIPLKAVVWNLIGGEALIAMDVIEDFTAYFKSRIKNMVHPWRYAYVIMLATNGVLYDTPRVQKYLFENRHHVYPAITIDGTQRKHDLHRVFPDGRGSYDIVSRNMRLAMRQFPHLSTKVTFAHDDLPYVCESVVHLWEMELVDVPANVVFEDVWEPGDSEILEAQLRELADVAIDKGYWKTRRCSFFWETKPDVSDSNVCGTGKGATVNWRGDIDACIRFAEHSISGSGKTTRPIGNIYSGFNSETARAFDCVRKSLISPRECLDCEIQDGCSWCLGHCYEVAASDTIFHRSTAICEMHKARWRANQYYWQQLEHKHNVKPSGSVVGKRPCLI